MSSRGYYMHPAIHGESVVFASDDDLWSVPAAGGTATRLTRARGSATRPAFSPDGSNIAYLGVEEGYPEVYVMPATGGESLRLTRLAAATLLLGWTPDAERVVYSTIAGRPNRRLFFVHTVPAGGGPSEAFPVGPAVALAFGPGGGVVIGRGSGLDPSWWKRYRGGRIGEIWIDRTGKGAFEKLIETGGNLAYPIWMKDRIFFHADHEGVGNLYSCTPEGSDLRRHTDHADFYLRSPRADGERIVYTAGGELHLWDPKNDASRKIEVDFPSQRPKRARRFVSAERFLQGYDLHPQGHSLALTARGRPLTLAHWEGAVRQHGTPGNRVRYRLARWLHDGGRLVAVSDEGGEEALEIHDVDGGRIKRLQGPDLGRPVTLQASPVKDEVVLSNHRGELIHVDLETGEATVLAQSRFGRIAGHDFSPDGRYVAFGFPESRKRSAILVHALETGRTHRACEPVLRDVSPCFDPGGKYLHFLSYAGFDPVRDILDFAYGFPRGVLPKLVTLKKDLPSPFEMEPKAPGAKGAQDKKKAEAEEGKAEGEEGPPPVEIDWEGIERRVVPYPVEPGHYTQIAALPDKVLYASLPVQGLLGRSWLPAEPEAKARLMAFDFETGKEECLVSGITDFQLGAGSKTMVYRAGRRLRVLPAGKKPDDEAPGPPSRKTGWIDMGRPRISVDFLEEWKQMFAEAWRLLRDHYYIEDMGGVDWEAVYRRYAPLVDRVSTRRELSDLFWEMGGELGTSHAYELGGDYPPEPRYPQGFLGADLAWTGQAWRIARIVEGEPGEPGYDSPLNAPGVGVKAGDEVLAVNGVLLGADRPPEDLLVNQGGQKVALRVRRGEEERTVTVKALSGEMPARHRAWVRNNRARVHAETDGRVGYIHISDMGPQGFSEFHRAFLTEVERDALIVDVRFNAGGHVSPLILERLCRKPNGYGVSRWTDPRPRPPESFAGPIVGLTDEFSGSDGDVFSHNFKQMNLGPLIGKRTWGGIVGLSPTHPLVDGTVTTQPEHFNWFLDVGYGLENHGAEPDVVVEITPQDYVAGRDPQLAKAIGTAEAMLEENPPASPDFSGRPDRTLPTLSPREGR